MSTYFRLTDYIATGDIDEAIRLQKIRKHKAYVVRRGSAVHQACVARAHAKYHQRVKAPDVMASRAAAKAARDAKKQAVAKERARIKRLKERDKLAIRAAIKKSAETGKTVYCPRLLYTTYCSSKAHVIGIVTAHRQRCKRLGIPCNKGRIERIEELFNDYRTFNPTRSRNKM